MVTSTWRAPASIAVSVFATARPRSSWQWTLMTACDPTRSTARRMSGPNSDGMAYPTVSGRLTVVAPASTTASTTCIR